VNFDDEYFGILSKVRTRLRNTLLVVCEIEKLGDLSCAEEDKTRISSLIE